MNSPSTLFMGTSSVIYVSVPDPIAPAPAGNNCSGLGLPTAPTNFTYHCAASSTYMKTDGTGWLPINFNSYAAGSVISKLPVDPTNTTSTNLYYTYETDGVGGFQVAAFFESQKEAPLMPSNSGIDAGLYEKGSNLTLASGRGLIGYWPLDEQTGTVALDESSNGNNGSFVNSYSYVPGKVGASAIMFTSAATGYINMSSTNLSPSSFSNGITISLWFQTSAPSAMQGVYVGHSSNYFQFSWGDGSGDLNTSWKGNGFGATGSLPTSTWTYLTATFNPNTRVGTTYINGNRFSAATYPSAPNFPASALTIGLTSASSGGLDDVRIYNRVLNAPEIQELYNAEK